MRFGPAARLDLRKHTGAFVLASSPSFITLVVIWTYPFRIWHTSGTIGNLLAAPEFIECLDRGNMYQARRCAPPTSYTPYHTRGIKLVFSFAHETVTLPCALLLTKIMTACNQGELVTLARVPGSIAAALLQPEINTIFNIEAITGRTHHSAHPAG